MYKNNKLYETMQRIYNLASTITNTQIEEKIKPRTQ